MLGVFRSDARTRMEFLELLRHRREGLTVSDLNLSSVALRGGCLVRLCPFGHFPFSVRAEPVDRPKDGLSSGPGSLVLYTAGMRLLVSLMSATLTVATGRRSGTPDRAGGGEVPFGVGGWRDHGPNLL